MPKFNRFVFYQIIFFFLWGGFPFLLFASPVSANETVRVLIYNGAGDWGSSAYRETLEYCEQTQIIPGFDFEFSYSGSYLDASDLKDKDLVMYPGGNYNMGSSTNTDRTAVREFVANGGGYFGTCAGGGAALTLNPNGGNELINLLPGVNAQQNWYNGRVSVRLTAAGAKIFGYGGDQLLNIVYGPIFSWDKNNSNFDGTPTVPEGLAVFYNNSSGSTIRKDTDGDIWTIGWDNGSYRQSLATHYGQGNICPGRPPGTWHWLR